MTPSPTGQQVGLACRGWAEGEDMSKELEDLLNELDDLMDRYSAVHRKTLSEIVERYRPTPPVEEPMEVGARVVSVNGRLFERFRRGTGQDYRDWWRFGSSAAFRWSEIVVDRIVFEGYDL